MAFYLAPRYPLHYPAGSHYSACAGCLLQQNGAENGGGTVTRRGMRYVGEERSRCERKQRTAKKSGFYAVTAA